MNPEAFSRCYQDSLEITQIAMDVSIPLPEIKVRITNQLPGTMVRYIASSIDANQFNRVLVPVYARKEVTLIPTSTTGENVRVFQQEYCLFQRVSGHSRNRFFLFNKRRLERDEAKIYKAHIHV